MNDERLVFVSEEEAGRLWKRAAELQVKASQRVEERSRDLHAPIGLPGLGERQHLALPDVLQAAREVGIDEVHIDAAVAELQEERAAGGPPAPDIIERCAARFFGSPPPALEVTTVLPAEPAEVYRILQRLLPGEPYRLRLRGAMGEDPLRDGVLVFDAPDADSAASSYARDRLGVGVHVGRLYVTLRPVDEGDGAACRVTVRGRIQSDPEPAFWLGSLLTAGGAWAGGALGVLGAAGLGMAGPVLALPAAAAAVLGGRVTYGSVRLRYLAPLRRGLEGLEELLEVVTAAVKTGGAFLAERGDGAGGAPGAGHRRDELRPPR